MADDSNEKNVRDEELGTTYHRGPVLLRGPMIPSSTTTGNLLAPEDSTDRRSSWTALARLPSWGLP